MKDKVEMEFVPLVGVGPFLFGEPARNLHHFDMEVIESLSSDEELVYGSLNSSLDGVRVYVEGGKIVGLGLYESLVFKGVNLIGLSYAEAEAVLDGPPTNCETYELDDGEQTVFDWDPLCLILWFKDERVVTAQCHEWIED